MQKEGVMPMSDKIQAIEEELTENFLTIINAFPYQENIETGFKAIVACGADIPVEAFERYKQGIVKIAEPNQQQLVINILKAMDKIRAHPECDKHVKGLLMYSMLDVMEPE